MELNARQLLEAATEAGNLVDLGQTGIDRTIESAIREALRIVATRHDLGDSDLIMDERYIVHMIYTYNRIHV